MRKFIIIFLGLVSLAHADLNSEELSHHKTCGLPRMVEINITSYMENLKTRDPLLYDSYFAENERVIQFNSENQLQQIFWAYNFQTNQPYTINATRRKIGEFTQIWVEDDSWNNNYVNNAILDDLLNNLESYSGSSSIDPNNGIVGINTTLFGQPPNYDGDGIVDFLILDIRDDFDPTQSNSSFIAGYFSPLDQQSGSTSNERDLMYLDAFPGIYYNGSYRTEPVMSTTAHEFQHLIHFNYDQNEELWINEGLSELAGTYCGYGLDFPGLFLEDPNQNLTQWSSEVKDYARVNLWTLYCAEQLGLPFIKDLTQNPANGVTGFNQALVSSGNSGDLSSVFSDWVLANYLNQQDPNPQYGYALTEAQGLRVKITNLVSEYSTRETGTVKSFGAEYHRFRGKDSLEISFLSAVPGNYWTIIKDNSYHIRNVTGNEILEPGFTEDSTYVLILFASGNDISYRYDAYAKYSLKYYEIAYDDNQTDLKINFQAQDIPITAANRFTVPAPNVELESISFWNGSKDHTVLVRVLGQTGSNLPGADLMTPLSVPLSIEEAWVDVLLPQPLTGLNQGDILYVGIQINSSDKSLGYDDQNSPGISYLNPRNSGWRALSQFQIGGEPANGLWMIRAVFSGLAESDSSLIGPEDEELIVTNGYPNPFLYTADYFAIQYQKSSNPGTILLEVFNALGQKVAEQHEDANGFVAWSARNEMGPLAAGIYYYRLIFFDAVTGEKLSSKYQKVIILN